MNGSTKERSRKDDTIKGKGELGDGEIKEMSGSRNKREPRSTKNAPTLRESTQLKEDGEEINERVKERTGEGVFRTFGIVGPRFFSSFVAIVAGSRRIQKRMQNPDPTRVNNQ